jgi:hypothetical protein
MRSPPARQLRRKQDEAAAVAFLAKAEQTMTSFDRSASAAPAHNR